MTSYVSLLRGVNLGSSRQLSMPALRQVYVDLGLGSVQTYIRSGNVVFTSEEGADTVRERIEAAVAAELVMDVDVVIRTHEDLVGVLARNPFPRADPAHLAVNFLREPAPTFLGDSARSTWPRTSTSPTAARSTCTCPTASDVPSSRRR